MFDLSKNLYRLHLNQWRNTCKSYNFSNYYFVTQLESSMLMSKIIFFLALSYGYLNTKQLPTHGGSEKRFFISFASLQIRMRPAVIKVAQCAQSLSADEEIV